MDRCPVIGLPDSCRSWLTATGSASVIRHLRPRIMCISPRVRRAS